MKKWMFALLVLLLALPAEISLAIGSKTASVQLASGKKYVSYVSFSASEPVELRPVLAQNKVGKTQELAQMAKTHKALAAINGTYFNPYDEKDLQPMGGIVINGAVQHFRGGAVAMGITAQNELIFSEGNPYSLVGTLNAGTPQEKSWSAFNVNHLPTSQAEAVLFTPTFRMATLSIAGFRFVAVSGGKVSAITKDSVVIPANGFVVAYGSQRSDIDSFHIGDTAAYRLQPSPGFEKAVHMISVGPRLVAAGKSAVDLSSFTEAKITTQKGQRSFIGMKADKTIMMGTVSNVTILELAEIAVKLGLADAMALDGGASSGLYYNGSYVTKAGRNLSNALVVVKKQQATVLAPKK
ncbi:UNVERIFIED_CONTAM: hypothetical protein ABID98_003339 [Brevibacillus sp. OAP136]